MGACVRCQPTGRLRCVMERLVRFHDLLRSYIIFKCLECNPFFFLLFLNLFIFSGVHILQELVKFFMCSPLRARRAPLPRKHLSYKKTSREIIDLHLLSRDEAEHRPPVTPAGDT